MDVPQKPWREPAPEEYSRVTNPERFRPLHQHAVDLLARLEATYEVTRSDAFDLLPDMMQPFEHARPPVTLTPAAPRGPVAVAFTAFPSLVVRYGRWHGQEFPSCGCDACDEGADDQAERLDDVIGKVVAGLFAEELRIPLFGDARLYQRLGDGSVRKGVSVDGWTTLSRAVARVLAVPSSRRVEWQPWPRRSPRATDSAPAV